jgi:hypothetical protein
MIFSTLGLFSSAVIAAPTPKAVAAPNPKAKALDICM